MLYCDSCHASNGAPGTHTLVEQTKVWSGHSSSSSRLAGLGAFWRFSGVISSSSFLLLFFSWLQKMSKPESELVKLLTMQQKWLLPCLTGFLLYTKQAQEQRYFKLTLSNSEASRKQFTCHIEGEIGEILQVQGFKIIWKEVLASISKDFLPLFRIAKCEFLF